MKITELLKMTVAKKCRKEGRNLVKASVELERSAGRKEFGEGIRVASRFEIGVQGRRRSAGRNE